MENNGKLPAKILKEMKQYPYFYQKVWKVCSQIPPGQTRTYGWVAKMAGHPGAARAVGQALARNPFAPMVPCHRVIGSKGQLVGFSGRGGISAKRKLLLKERTQFLG